MRRKVWFVVCSTLALAAPVDAAPAPRTAKLYVHIGETASGVAGEFDFYLDARDYPDAANRAGNMTNGLPNEVAGATGGGWRNVFPAKELVPLRLDARRAVTGRIAVGVYEPNVFVATPAGVGQVVVDLELVGTPAGAEESVVLGKQTAEFLVTPAAPLHVVEVEMEPDPALHGTTFSEIALVTNFRGASLLTGFFELDDPASFLEIPTLRPHRT